MSIKNLSIGEASAKQMLEMHPNLRPVYEDGSEDKISHWEIKDDDNSDWGDSSMNLKDVLSDVVYEEASRGDLYDKLNADAEKSVSKFNQN